MLQFRRNESVKFYQWDSVDNKVQKCLMELKKTKCVEFLEKEIKSFKFHSYIVSTQLRFFDTVTNIRQKDKIVVVLDFSEKYRPKNQYEIQTAHYSYVLVPCLTGAAYFPSESSLNKSDIETEDSDEEFDESENETSKPITFGIISDCKEQDKFTVYTMVTEIIQYLSTLSPENKEIELWTDGAPTQFKNKFTLSTIPLLEAEFEIKITWNFFPTSHGKTIADGVGGNLKNMVDRRIASQNIQIRTALDFFKVLEGTNTPIQLFYVPKERIAADKIKLQEYWDIDDKMPKKDNLKLIKDCRMNHCFHTGGSGKLVCSITSSGKGQTTHTIF